MTPPNRSDLERAGLTPDQAIVINELVATQIFNAEQRLIRWSLMASIGVAWLVILALWAARG